MQTNTLPHNKVLSFNRAIVPSDYIDSPPNTDIYDTAVKASKHKVSMIADHAEKMVSDWNDLGAYAIKLAVERNHETGFRIIGQWLDCLPVDSYTQELDTLSCTDWIGREAYKSLTTALSDIDVNFDCIDLGINTAVNSIQFALFNNKYFADLHNTSFFKHIGKAFKPLVIRSEFDEANSYNQMPFFPTEDEQQAEFKKILKSTFEVFLDIEYNPYILEAVNAFDLEQVAIASAQAAIIMKSCRDMA